MYYHCASIQGRRPYNEDEYDVFDNLEGGNAGKVLSYFAVFDGHGGGSISKYLKANLRSYFVNDTVQVDPCKGKSYDKYIVKVYDFVQKQFVNFNQSAKATGSTACVCIVHKYNNHMLLKMINLGDCRVVSCNTNNIAVPLTKDHKPTSFDEYQRITSNGGTITKETNDDHRINGLSVSRSFGDLDSKPHVSHLPDIYDYDLKKTKFFIMACDGVWDVLGNQEAVDYVLSEMDMLKSDIKSNFTSSKAKANIANKLVQYAYDRGSQDNLTAIIVFL